MAKVPTPEADTKTKVYNLYNELLEARKDKKDIVKSHSENIKRIEAEIKEVLDAEEDDVKESQKTVD